MLVSPKNEASDEWNWSERASECLGWVDYSVNPFIHNQSLVFTKLNFPKLAYLTVKFYRKEEEFDFPLVILCSMMEGRKSESGEMDDITGREDEADLFNYNRNCSGWRAPTIRVLVVLGGLGCSPLCCMQQNWISPQFTQNRDRLKSMHQVAWMLQAIWGRSDKQQQLQNSPNLVHRLWPISV